MSVLANPEWIKRRLAMEGLPEPASNLAARMRLFADELVEPMVCRSPGYAAPGRSHCAACCYGTGLIITCAEDQAIADAASALHKAARIVELEVAAEQPTGDAR